MNMNNLSDDLLTEIWSRVPYKTVVRGKSISKRFLALISQHQFVERFILHNHTLFQQMKDEENQKWNFNFISDRKLLISFSPNLNLSTPQNQISFNFLGRKFDEKLDNITRKKHVLYSRIVGFSNGLFLCKKTTSGKVYHVCNILTKDWIKLPLPPPPRTAYKKHDRVLEGFVCQPYYHVEENTKKVTLNHHKFRVVRFYRFEGTISEILWGITKTKIKMAVFSSETGKWSEKIVSCQNGFSFTQSKVLLPVVAHEGILYFMGRTSVLKYDPFNNDKQCDIISFPSDTSDDITFNGHVGVCCGKIRMSCFCTFQACAKVWELEKDHSWRLLHVTCFPPQYVRDCVVDELLMPERREILDLGTQVRAFHPYDGDVVFLQRAHRIFVGNLKTNKIEGVGYGIHGFQSLQMISVDFPLWPTPIPSIIKHELSRISV